MIFCHKICFSTSVITIKSKKINFKDEDSQYDKDDNFLIPERVAWLWSASNHNDGN